LGHHLAIEEHHWQLAVELATRSPLQTIYLVQHYCQEPASLYWRVWVKVEQFEMELGQLCWRLSVKRVEGVVVEHL